MEEKIHIIFGGDVMLGRLVKNEIHNQGSNYPLGKIASILQHGDVTIVNLECAITKSKQLWTGVPKAFYFGAPPIAAKILRGVGVSLVSLANNHSLDFDIVGLMDTLNYLKQENIQYVGAGRDITEALTPAIFSCKNLKFGMVAFCDHQEDFAASDTNPGIAYLDLHDGINALAKIQISLTQLKKEQVDWPILSLHWGPNMLHRPSHEFIQFAHDAVDLGFKIIFGHSAHVFHGIEIYRDCPIIYSAGDLVDDYYVDPEFKNDHQLIFEFEIVKNRVKKIFLYPLFIEYCHVKPAIEDQFKFIAKRAEVLCQEMGTLVKRYDAERLVIEVG